MSEIYDVIILGAGPAGLAAGRLAVDWMLRPPMLMPPPRGLPERLPPGVMGME